KPDEGDDFKLPKAESVGDVEHSTHDTKAPREADQLEFTSIGLAQIAIGERPPWSGLESLEAGTPAPKDVPTRWRMLKSIWVGQGYLHHATFVPGGDSVVTLSNQTGSIYHYD